MLNLRGAPSLSPGRIAERGSNDDVSNILRRDRHPDQEAGLGYAVCRHAGLSNLMRNRH
jgi:hypothetical protein